jgi:hypothetical protein
LFSAGIKIAVAGRLADSILRSALHYVLDGKDDASYSPSKSPTSEKDLYSSPPLPPGRHTLALRSVANDTTLFIEGMNITILTGMTDGPHGHKKHIPEIVGGTIGGVIFLALVLLAFLLYRRRKNGDKRKYLSIRIDS